MGDWDGNPYVKARKIAVLLAGGIGTALVTTFWGLLIAIPATSAYALIRNRAIATSDEMLAAVDEMVALFRPNATDAASASPSTSSVKS